MAKEVLVLIHVYNGTLLSQKRNKFESVKVRWMNLETVIQSEVSHSEREKQILYINRYVWNLEKW